MAFVYVGFNVVTFNDSTSALADFQPNLYELGTLITYHCLLLLHHNTTSEYLNNVKSTFRYNSQRKDYAYISINSSTPSADYLDFSWLR